MNLRNKLAKNSIYFIFFAVNFLIAVQFSAVSALSGKIADFFAFPKNLEYWITDAYLVAIFISLLVFLASAKYIDRKIKRKNFFLEGMTYFSLGSLACYFANTADLFIFGRIIQGLGAGIILFLQLTTPATYQNKSHLRYFWAIAGLAAGFTSGNYFTAEQNPSVLFWNNFISGLFLFFVSTKYFQDLLGYVISKFKISGYLEVMPNSSKASTLDGIKTWSIYANLQTFFEELFHDIGIGIRVLTRAWSLFVVIAGLCLTSLIITLSWKSIGNDPINSMLILFKNIAISLLLLLTILVVIEIFRMIKKQPNASLSSFSKHLTGFYIFYNLLNIISRLTDILMIVLIINFGLIAEILIVIPLYFAISIWNMMLYDRFRLTGHDLLQIDYFRKLSSTDIGFLSTNINIISLKSIKRIIIKIPVYFLSIILKSRVAIFILGSIFILEPDIVTLLLRKKQEVTVRNALLITLPSNILCISLWSVIFYYGIYGFRYITNFFINY